MQARAAGGTEPCAQFPGEPSTKEAPTGRRKRKIGFSPLIIWLLSDAHLGCITRHIRGEMQSCEAECLALPARSYELQTEVPGARPWISCCCSPGRSTRVGTAVGCWAPGGTAGLGRPSQRDRTPSPGKERRARLQKIPQHVSDPRDHRTRDLG